MEPQKNLKFTPKFTPKNDLGTTMRNRVPVCGGKNDFAVKLESYKNPEFQGLIQRFQLQEVSRRVHLHQDWMSKKEFFGLKEMNKLTHRVCHCLHTSRSDIVNLLKNPNRKTADYGNLQVCGSVWACPICASKITEQRRKDIHEACEKWILKDIENNHMLMVTFTIPHNSNQSLELLRDFFMQARRLMKQQKVLKRDRDFMPYRSIKKQYQIKGEITGLEVTSGKNGWHTHSHDLLFVSGKLRKSQIAYLQYLLTTAWIKALQKSKFRIPSIEDMYKHSVKVDQANTPADYISKFGQIVYEEKKDVLSSGWGVSQELVKSHIKQGRQDGLTPWDFLRIINNNPGDESIFKKYGKLFREYTRVFHGKRQLFFSKGFRKFLGMIQEKTDEEIAEETDKEAVLIGILMSYEWKIIIKNKLRAILRIISADWTIEQVREFLFAIELHGKRKILKYV